MKVYLTLGLLGTLFGSTILFAQQPPDNGPGQQPDPAQAQANGDAGEPPRGGPGRLLARLKEELAASDEQWAAMSGKILTILQLEHVLYAIGPGGPPPNGGPPPGGLLPAGGPPEGALPDGGAPDAAMTDPNTQPAGATTQPAVHAAADVRQAKRAVGDLAHQPQTTTDEFLAATKTLRNARESAKTSLAAAQAELKPMVNPRQEAILVAFGILD